MSIERPNLVFVFCDELRQAALGCYGQDPVTTPNLDRFAQQSLVLTHCVSNQPVCTPYRGMLFTGRYPYATGLYANCNSLSPVALRDSERCLGDVLSEQGYALGYLGKLHLHKPTEACARYGEGPRSDGKVWDAYTPPGPARHGFDFWYSYGCCDRHFDPHYWTGDAPVDQPVKPGEWSVKHETDVAVEYLRNTGGRYRDPGKPFVLMVSHNPPHMPFDQLPQEYAAPFRDMGVGELLNRPNVRYRDGRKAQRDAANYFGAILGIDTQFQRILDALDERGLVDNTIVVFTSDHGEMMHSHERMGKSVWYDESLLVPWLIRWPGHIKAGHDDLLFGATDIYPTLLGLLGLGGACPSTLEGDDRSSIFLGHGGQRPTSAFYLLPDASNVPGPRGFIEARGLRTHTHTYILGRYGEGREHTVLHDNVSDPYQLRNVAKEQPERVNTLRLELESWLKKTRDPWRKIRV